LSFPAKGYSINSYLILSDKYDDATLIQYKLGSIKSKRDYSKAVVRNKGKDISFARFDITKNVGSYFTNIENESPNLAYSFSAENYSHPKCNDAFTELAIRCPISVRPNCDLLSWIIRSHFDSLKFEGGINVSESVRSISNCICENANQLSHNECVQSIH